MKILDLVRGILLYPIGLLMDYAVIDEDPELIKEKKLEEPLSTNQYIEKYC